MTPRWSVLGLLVLLGAKPVLSGPPEDVIWSTDGSRVVLGGRRTGTVVFDTRGKGRAVATPGLGHPTLTPDGAWVIGAREDDFVAEALEDGTVEPIPAPGGGRPIRYFRTAEGDVAIVKNTAHHDVHLTHHPFGDPVTVTLRNFERAWVDRRDPLLYVDTGYGLEIRQSWTGQVLRVLDSERPSQQVVDAVRTADDVLVIALRDQEGFRIWTPPDAPGAVWDLSPEAPLSLSGDGAFLAIGGAEGVELRSVADRQVLAVVRTREPVVALAVSPDARFVAVVGPGGSPRLLQLELEAPPPNPVAREPSATDTGRLAGAVLRRPPAPIRRFDQTLSMPGTPGFLGWTPGGRLAGWVGAAWVELEPGTGKTVEPKVPKLIPGSPYAWSADGAVLAGVTATGVALIEVRRWRVVRELPTGGQHHQLQWHGQKLVVDTGSGRAQAWDTDSGVPLGEPFLTSTDATSRFVQSPDGELLAVRGRVPQVLKVATGRPLAPLVGQTGGVAAVAFSPDGARLAAAGNDGSLVVWDTAIWRPVVSVEGAHGMQLAFSPAGDLLASVSYDGGVVVEVATGNVVERLPFDGLLASVNWSTQGLAISDNAGNVYVRAP